LWTLITNIKEFINSTKKNKQKLPRKKKKKAQENNNKKLSNLEKLNSSIDWKDQGDSKDSFNKFTNKVKGVDKKFKSFIEIHQDKKLNKKISQKLKKVTRRRYRNKVQRRKLNNKS
jgi:hypothetical protein